MSTSSHIRLSDLNEQIGAALSDQFEYAVWVVAEIVKFNTNAGSGHTYFELAEKQGDRPVAQANLWKFKRNLLDEFASVAGHPLAPGMQVLLSVKVDFHSVYGLSLNIQDIDANYTLGDIARKRQ